MAKIANPKIVTVDFPRTGNPWIDAGIVGLHRVLGRKLSYLEPLPSDTQDKTPGSAAFPNVEAELQAEKLSVRGPKDEVQECLERAYDCVIACYYNISTKRQRADQTTHNFYLQAKTEKFDTFPKQRAAGAALLMFDKAARPVGSQEKWGEDPVTGKTVVGRLPDRFAHLQSKLDALLASKGMKAGPPAGLLVDGRNEVRPKVKIRVDVRPGPDEDFLYGQPRAGLTAGKQTAFPLFGGSRAFVSETGADPRVGWEIDYAGKFVPAVSFYYTSGADLFLFLPESSDLTRLADLADALQRVTLEKDDNFYRNFELKLGGYFNGRAEITFAFLHRVFLELSKRRRTDSAAVVLSDAPPDEDPENDKEEVEEPIEPGDVYNVLARGAPVNFTVVSARKQGNVWKPRDFLTFTEALYMARLLGRMTETVQQGDAPARMRCHPKRLMHALLDFSTDKDKSLLRDSVCDGILRKQSVLALLERHAYRQFGQWQPGGAMMIRPLLDFATFYEPALKEESQMEKQAYEEMVKRAQWLGRNIAKAVAEAGKGTDRNESAGRSKGVFFRLRRVRKPADFLNELSRLQMRYKIEVPKDALAADGFNAETFPEYRGFCAIAALNHFQYLTSRKGDTAATSPQT